MPSPISSRRRLALLTTPLLLASPAGLVACSSDSSSGPKIAVTASETACTSATTAFAAGSVTFEVTNKGSKTTEVYVYGKKNGGFTEVVGEAENIGPGTSRSFSADLKEGTFELACKPGQKGNGIRTALTVTGS